MKYWMFPSQAEVDQLRREANHQFIAAHYDGDMEADVSKFPYPTPICILCR